MSLVSGEDPLLHRRIDRTELDKAALVEVVQGMLGTMLVEGGVGLAANQVGLDLRIALVKEVPTDNVMVLVNPEIIKKGAVTSVKNEGCLSYPGKVVLVERSNKIMVKYQDLHGADLIANFSGYVARIIQHEVDHLNGITILDRNKEYERSRL